MRRLPLGISPRQGVLAAVAAILGAAAFPPIGFWPLILVSISFFLRLIHNQDTQTARNIGVVYGFVFAISTMYWLFAIFGFVAFPLIALMAIYFGLLATCIGLTRNYSFWLRAFLIGLFALAIEWLRGDAWYLRFPWYTPTHALAQSPPCIASARWLGTYGLSFSIWFIAAVGALGRHWYWLAFALLPVASLLLPVFDPSNRQVLLVQAEGETDLETVLAQLPHKKVDLTVLPEYAYQRSPRSALSSSIGPRSVAEKTDSPVVFGAVEGEYGTLTFSNIAAVVDSQAKLLGTFPKQRPVPLMLDGVPGKRRPVFPIEQGVLGVAVCYDFDAPEISASLVKAGATVLVAPTFDAMSWTQIEHIHHELLIRLRAVENDRWVLRAVSSGRSEVIDPHGVPSPEGIGIGEKGFIVLPFGHRSTTPLGGQLHVLGPSAALFTVLYLVGCVSCRIRHWWSRSSHPNSDQGGER